jgi:2-polyprenyl-6-methoxyphenol hydroxylase-like FAD-dependent oxidoreductase
MNSKPRGHAVVIGASMAGLLTANVLRDHFADVTVLERDRLPDEATLRKGTPQARHLHSYWLGGLQAVERMLPGYTADLAAAGAVPVRQPTDVRWLAPPGWIRRFPPTTRMLFASRPLLEWALRRRVATTPGIRVLDGHEVEGLRVGGSGDVDGVMAAIRGGDRFSLSADLVVDASGQGSKLPQWLKALGCRQPAESIIDGHMGYATRYFTIPPGSRDWKGIYIQPAPPAHCRGGVMFPVEGNRWLVTLVGGGGDYPPTDEAGFLAFARSLRSDALYDAFSGAEPISPIWGYRRTANHRRHYERLRGMPGRLLVLGDSLCSFNPVYGQGMTVAARQAERLSELLCSRPPGDLARVTHRLQGAMASVAEGAWMVSTGEDLRYPSAEGARVTAKTRITHRYMDRVLAAVAVDPVVNTAFLRVLNMIDPPQALFRPRTMSRVLVPRGTTLRPAWHGPAGETLNTSSANGPLRART